MDAEIPRWVEEFRRKHGRSPAVLHIGNIANNAYRNAQLLRQYGVACDVICYDYYHLMACPEWEDADFEGAVKDQRFPDWNAVNLRGYKRPNWFVQGPVLDCLRYLQAKRQNKKFRAWFLWHILTFKRSLKCSGIRQALDNIGRLRDQAWGRPLFYLSRSFAYLFLGMYYVIALLLLPITAPLKARKKKLRSQNAHPKAVTNSSQKTLGSAEDANKELLSFVPEQPYTVGRQADKLVSLFKEKFPDRMDQLVARDILERRFVHHMAQWRNTIKHYDIIQAYATDPIIPLFADFTPYIAYEHGTLRDFTQANNSVSRNTSLAYHLADHVFITNGDCLAYAEKIGVARYSAMLHPINEEHIRQVQGNYQQLHDKFGVQYLFLCTLRHDWDIKGTDVYIRALPGIAETLGRNFKVLMTQWGKELEQSKALAQSLGVSDLIAWIEPLNRHELFRHMKSVDILFDQIKLPHFGATAPEGIAAEVPVIMSYEPASTAWIVEEPAPILSAFTPEEVVSCVLKALDPSWKQQYRAEAKRWIDRHHSSKIIAATHLKVYEKLLMPAASMDAVAVAEMAHSV